MDYCTIGRDLTNDPYRLAFVTFLKGKFQNQVKKNHRPPFVFVIASSGIGKTQLAFSLFEFRVLYIPLVYNSDSQKIYNYFAGFWDQLRNAILLDRRSNALVLNQLEDVSLAKLMFLIQSRKLSYTAGFLIAAMSFMKGDNTWNGVYDVSKLPSKFEYTAEPLNELNNVSSTESDIIIVLDEFFAAKYTDSVSLAFLRNIFRACRFTVVIMGTHSNALNMVTKSAGVSSIGSGSDIPDPTWCYVWHALPETSEKLRTSIQKISYEIAMKFPSLEDTLETLNSLIATERPLIAQYLMKFLSQILDTKKEYSRPVDLMDDFILYVSQALLIKKAVLKPTMGTFYWNYAFGIDIQPSKMSFLSINSHFSVLNANEWLNALESNFVKTYLLFGDSEVSVDFMQNRKFTDSCFASFRPFREETILRLALTGYKFSLWDSGSNCFMKLFYSSCALRLNQLVLQKALVGRDGDCYESMMRLCVMQASHANGVFGSTLREFLVAIGRNLYSVDLKKLKIVCYGKNGSSLLFQLLDYRIPFLGPVGATWNPVMANWARKHKVYLANLEAPPDKFMTDMLTQEIVTISDFEEPILSSTVSFPNLHPCFARKEFSNSKSSISSLRIPRVLQMECKNWNRAVGNPQLHSIFLKNISNIKPEERPKILFVAAPIFIDMAAISYSIFKSHGYGLAFLSNLNAETAALHVWPYSSSFDRAVILIHAQTPC
jgi:hypothetical protein